jgi:hypothetical protein
LEELDEGNLRLGVWEEFIIYVERAKGRLPKSDVNLGFGLRILMTQPDILDINRNFREINSGEIATIKFRNDKTLDRRRVVTWLPKD